MQQAMNITLPPTNAASSTAQHEDPISREDRVSALTISSKFAPMNLVAKKALLRSMATRGIKKDILEKATLFDIANSSTLSNVLDRLLPASVSSFMRSTNQELAAKLADLYDPLTLLHGHLQEQQDCFIASLPTTRNTAPRSRDSVLVLLDSFTELFKKVDHYARDSSNNEGNAVLGIKSITLSRSQRERTFHPSRVPIDAAYSACPLCSHDSVNDPVENTEVLAYNSRLQEEHTQKTDLWNRFEESKAKGSRHAINKPTCPFTSRVMQRRPQRPKFNMPIFQCMCSTSSCIMENSNTSSSCPVKCINNATGDRYPYTGLVNRSCTCPYCKCTCIFACNKDDFQKAQISRLCLPVGSDARNNNEPAAKTSMFMRSMLNGAFASSFDYMNMENGANSKEEITAFGEKLFYENAASNIVKKGQNLDASCLEYLRAEVGKPNSQVILPNGNGFDTNYVAHQSQHAHNNRLRQGDLTGIKEVHVGMVDNLTLDLANPTAEFIDAARKRRTEFVDLTGGSSEEPDYRTPSPPSSRVGVMVTKSTPPQNNVDKRAKSMHNRAKKRAHNRMSVVVKDLGLGRNNTPNKSEKKMLKRTLKGMNHAEQGNTATADVRAVTDDGDELILSSPLMIDSQDVLDRLIILHDDDE